jgi:hypothetical protein
MGMRCEVMGIQNVSSYYSGGTVPNAVEAGASGSALPKLASLYIGANPDGTNALVGTIDQIIFRRTGPWYRVSQTPQGVMFSTSLCTSYECQPPLMASARSSPGYRSLGKILNFAHPGATAANMISSLQAYLALNRLASAPKWVLDDSGINELQGGASAVQVCQDKQLIINEFAAAWAGVPIVCPLLGPCAADFSTGENAVWLTVNSASGAGSFMGTVTGVSAWVWSHIPTIGSNASWVPGDANSNLQSQYQSLEQGPSDYDPLHDNSASRAIRSAALVTALGSTWQG